MWVGHCWTHVTVKHVTLYVACVSWRRGFAARLLAPPPKLYFTCAYNTPATQAILYAAAYHRKWIFKASERFSTQVVLRIGDGSLKFVTVSLQTAESCQCVVSRNNSGVDVWYLIQLSFVSCLESLKIVLLPWRKLRLYTFQPHAKVICYILKGCARKAICLIRHILDKMFSYSIVWKASLNKFCVRGVII